MLQGHHPHKGVIPVKELGGLVVAKGVAMASIALAVVHSGLSAFDQALIIAGASATITGLFTVFAAWITVKFAARPIHEEIKAAHEQADDNRVAIQEVKDKLDE